MGGLFDQPISQANFPPPREFQERAHQSVRDAVRRGVRKMILAAATGAGKTYLGLRFGYEANLRGRSAIFVCDREALIHQTSRRADDYGLPHGIIQADNPRRDNSQLLQIASIQTIQKRGYWPSADVIVIDEAHSTYTAVKELLANTSAVVIGLTATPCTAGLGNLYDGIINAATMAELTDSGVLVPMRILTCVKPDMTGAKKVGGEWSANDAAEREAKIIGDVVAEWQTHGENRKTIAFGANIAYCNELAQRFNAAGVGASVYVSDTATFEREQILREFAKPDPAIRVLISVEALAKGFDQPDVGCVIDARPLRKSLSTAIQMWGRGLRSSPGKKDCILLDHTGNITRFYDDFVDIYFNGFKDLDSSEKLDAKSREEAEFTQAGCPKCKRKPFRKRCLACGFEAPAIALIDETPGEMKEIRIGKNVAAADSQDLWNQLCTIARTTPGIAKKAGWCFFKYQDITGQKPPRSFDFEAAPTVEVTMATKNKIRQLQIKWRKGGARHATA